MVIAGAFYCTETAEPKGLLDRINARFDHAGSAEGCSGVSRISLTSCHMPPARWRVIEETLSGKHFCCICYQSCRVRSVLSKVRMFCLCTRYICVRQHGTRVSQAACLSLPFGHFPSPGAIHLQFQSSGNHYVWRKVTSTVHNIIVGKLWIDQVFLLAFLKAQTRTPNSVLVNLTFQSSLEVFSFSSYLAHTNRLECC